MEAARATGRHFFPSSTFPSLTYRCSISRGHDGEEFEDLDEYTTFKPRRRSNSISHAEGMMPTKFDQNDPEPVFEEELEPVDTNTSTASTISAASAKA